MPIKISVFIFSVSVLFGCNSTSEKNIENPIDKTIPDTSIFFTVNSVRQQFLVKKNVYKMAKDLQTFLNQYTIVPETYYDTLTIDFTGDTIPEKIITRIENTKDNSILYSIIMVNDSIVLTDTLDPADELSFMGWYSDSLYYKLKPYSLFFETFQLKNRIEEIENQKIDEEYIDFFIQGFKNDPKLKSMDSLTIKIKTDSIAEELRSYKGKFIMTLDQWDRSILIWNKHIHNFELLYAP